MNLSESISVFISDLRRRGYSQRTLDAYSFDLNKFHVFLNAKNPEQVSAVSSVTDTSIKNWIDSCMISGNSLKTIARKVASIKSFFKFMFQENYIKINPVERIRIPRVPKRPPSALSIDEIRQLLTINDREDPNFLLYKALLSLIYSAGLRVSEAASLNMENINLERRVVLIPGKGAKERLVPFQDSVYSSIIEYFLYREVEHPESIGPKKPAFLKQTQSGLVRMNVRRIQYLVEKLGKNAGLSCHVHPHLLRHSIATHLIEQGCSVEAVRQTLGHEDLATTSIYLKSSSKFLSDEHVKHNPINNILK